MKNTQRGTAQNARAGRLYGVVLVLSSLGLQPDQALAQAAVDGVGATPEATRRPEQPAALGPGPARPADAAPKAIAPALATGPLQAAAEARTVGVPAEGVPAEGVPAENEANYAAGVSAFLQGDFARAETLFEQVEGQPGPRQAAAAELRTVAARLRSRGARLTFPVANPPAQRAQSAVPGGPLGRAATGQALDQSGRASFVVSSTLVGIYSGAYILDLADVADFRAGVLIVMGTTAAGLLGSYYGTERVTVTDAMADAYSTGLLFGGANGLMLGAAANIERSELLQTAVVLGMGLGGASGLLLADAVRPTRGQVGFVGLTGLMGFSTVGFGLGIAQPQGLQPETALVALTLGLDAGTLAGMLLGADLDWSVSRQRYVGLSTFLGALGGWGIAALATGADSADDTTGRVWSAAALTGMGGGFALGIYLTSEMGPDSSLAADTNAWSVAPLTLEGAHGLSLLGRF